MIQSKIINNNLKTDTKNLKMFKNENNDSNQSENENYAFENWKGLGEPKNETKKSKYIDKDPSVLYYNENSRTKSQVIGILRNGNCSDLM